MGHKLSLACLILGLALAAPALAVTGDLPDRLKDIEKFADVKNLKLIDCANYTQVQNFKQYFLKDIFSPELLKSDNWTLVACNLINGLLPGADFEFQKEAYVDKKLVNISCPTTRVDGGPFGFPVDKLFPQPHICGRVARLWIRILFHDCGTYDRKKNTGGCNGSLRFEIPSGDFTPPFKDTFEKNLTIGQVPPPNEKNFNFKNKKHPENNGFAPSISFFESCRHKNFSDVNSPILYYKGYPISWVDTAMLGGIMGTWICGAPAIKFKEGRVDSYTEDDPGLLPSPLDSFKSIKKAFNRMKLNKKDMLILAGGSHSCQGFALGNGDKTPSKMDKQWAVEAQEIAKYLQGKIKYTDNTICKADMAANFSSPQLIKDAQDKCALPFVVDFAKSGEVGEYVDEFAAKTDVYFSAAFSDSVSRLIELYPGWIKPQDGDYDGESYSEDTPEDKKKRQDDWRVWGRRMRM